MELPHIGAVFAAGTKRARYSSTCTPAASSESDDASISGSSPDLVCIVRTKSSICASASAGWCTTRSIPSSSSSSSRVGDGDGDLDDAVPLDVEPGHLEVEPHQPVVRDSLAHGVTITTACRRSDRMVRSITAEQAP